MNIRTYESLSDVERWKMDDTHPLYRVITRRGTYVYQVVYIDTKSTDITYTNYARCFYWTNKTINEKKYLKIWKNDLYITKFDLFQMLIILETTGEKKINKAVMNEINAHRKKYTYLWI